MELEPLSPEVRSSVCDRLQHCFDLMMEAVEYRLDVIKNHDVRQFVLIPAADYQSIRIYTSDVDKIRRLLSGEGSQLAYVSFIGQHRPGVMEAVEATDLALIGNSPKESPILGYFSLQDPNLAWINLVLFDDLDVVARWVSATKHADDWAKAAAFFTEIEKSIGHFDYSDGRVQLDPMRFIVRDYDAVTS